MIPQISALRVIVTVKEGLNQYQLAALIAPPGGAKAPEPGSLNRGKKNEGGEPVQANGADPLPRAQPPPGGGTQGGTQGGGGPGGKSLNYPFTLLEIRENGAIPKAPIPSPSP